MTPRKKTNFKLFRALSPLCQFALENISVFHDERMICNFLHNLTATNCRQFFLSFVKKGSGNAISLRNNFVMMSEKVPQFLCAQKRVSHGEGELIIYISCIIVARNNTICILNISPNTLQRKLHLKVKLKRHKRWWK